MRGGVCAEVGGLNIILFFGSEIPSKICLPQLRAGLASDWAEFDFTSSRLFVRRGSIIMRLSEEQSTSI